MVRVPRIVKALHIWTPGERTTRPAGDREKHAAAGVTREPQTLPDPAAWQRRAAHHIHSQHAAPSPVATASPGRYTSGCTRSSSSVTVSVALTLASTAPLDGRPGCLFAAPRSRRSSGCTPDAGDPAPSIGRLPKGRAHPRCTPLSPGASPLRGWPSGTASLEDGSAPWAVAVAVPYTDGAVFSAVVRADAVVELRVDAPSDHPIGALGSLLMAACRGPPAAPLWRLASCSHLCSSSWIMNSVRRMISAGLGRT